MSLRRRGAAGVIVLLAVLPGGAEPAAAEGAPSLSREYPVSDPVFTAQAGSQGNPKVATDGRNSLVVWEDQRSGAIYAARVTSGGALDPGGLAITTRGGQSPAVAWNGADYLVVWEESVLGIFGALVSAEGVVRKGDIRLSPACSPAPPSGQCPTGERVRTPAVASDGRDFLVVWVSAIYPPDPPDPIPRDLVDHTVVSGARVSGAGEVIDPVPIRVSPPTNAYGPAVAWNGTDYLAAWENYGQGDGDIYAARIAPAGVVLDPLGIAIATGPTHQSGVAVASRGGELLVVWTEGPTVMGARVAGGGQLLDPRGIVVATGLSVRDAGVAWNGGNYLVVWRHGFDNELQIRSARVTPTGVVRDSGTMLTAPPSLGEPAVSALGADWAVVWSERDVVFQQEDIFFGRVGFGGSLVPGSRTLASATANTQLAPAVAWNGTHYRVAWKDLAFGEATMSTHLTDAGEIVDELTQRVSGNSVSDPAGASNGTDYLFAWRTSGGAGVKGTILRADGSFGPQGFTISSTALADWVTVASDGAGWLVVWSFGSQIYGARVSATGAVLDPAGIAVSGDRMVELLRPAVAWGGADYLVAWTDRGEADNVVAARVSPSGVVRDPQGIGVTSLGTARPGVAVASDGAGFLLLWEDNREGPLRIFGARVRSGGDVLDPQGVAVSRGGPAGSPSVAFNGKDYVAGWADAPSGEPGGKVYAARVSPGGFVRDPDGIEIAVADLDLPLPRVAAGPTGRVAIAYTRADTERRLGADRVFMRFLDDPANDAFADARGLTGLGGTVPGVNSGATTETEEPSHGTGGRKSVWYRWTAPAGGLVTFDTPEFTFQTLVGVYTGASLGSLIGVGPNFVTRPGVEYRIAVDGAEGAAGFFRLRWATAVDATGPALSITSGPQGTVAESTATFSFEATDPNGIASVECSLDGGAFVACTSPLTYRHLADAGHTFVVRATDRAGNVAVASRAWTVSGAPPFVDISGGPREGDFVTDRSAAFTLQASKPGSSLECALDGAPLSPCTSPHAFTGLSEGPHRFEAQATLAGSTGPVETRRWTVDTSPPVVEIVRPRHTLYVADAEVVPVAAGPAAMAVGRGVTVEARASDSTSGVRSLCFVYDGDSTCPAPQGDVYRIFYKAPADGQIHTVEAVADNRAGLSSTARVGVLGLAP